MSERRVELLAFDGCPNTAVALERVRLAIDETKVAARVEVVSVESEEDAKRLQFLGSPTVRVDGADIDPTAGSRHDYGLRCRVYPVGTKLEGAPPLDWFVSALRAAERKVR